MSLAKEKIIIPCPGCNKDIEITYYDVYTRKTAQCRRCKSSYKFNSRFTSKLQSSIRDFERAQEKFQDAFQDVISNADIDLKKK